MATVTRCERCGATGGEVHCPECDGGLGLGTLFRQYEQLVGERHREAVREGAAAAHPGNRFGDYVRVQLLGDGGMGEVWKAWDRKLRRWVALKFPKCESAADLAQLRVEAASAGILTHPNVATIYGAGQANGHHFIAMQYIDGVTLAEYPRDDRRKLIAFVRYAAMGVACAHSHGIIHRDLKPENIMVSRDREQIYVTDFGIARRASAGTKATEVIGTPPYMSPEQARGEPVDCRSDVYSLAATLYDLLADRPPFIGASPADTLRRVLTDDAEPLRHLDADLNAILLKGLDKVPAERYPTVHEFAEDLQRYLRDEPVRARRPSVFTVVRKMLKRHRVAALAGVAGLAAALLVGMLFWNGRRDEQQRRVAEQRRHEAVEVERRAQGARLLEAEATARNDLRELLLLWSQVVLAKQGWYQPRRNPQATRKEIETAVSGLNDYVARHPEQLQGYYVRARGRLYIDNLDGARSDLEKAISLEPGFGPGWALLGRVKAEQFFLNLIGDPKDYAARLRESTPLLQEANVAFEHARKERVPAASTGGWGLETMEDERPAEVLARAMAVAFLDRNLDAARRLLEEAHRASPSEEYCNLLGVWAAEPAGNIAWQTEALAIRPHYALACFDRAAAKATSGDAAGALADYTRALEIDPRFLPARYNRARLYLGALREPRKALDDFAQMLKVNSKIALVYSGRASARAALGDLPGALEEMNAALALAPRDARLYAVRAEVRNRLKDHAGALEDVAAALLRDPREPIACAQRAVAKAGLGDAPGALEDSRTALLLDPRSAVAFCTRAWAKNQLDDPAGAIEDASAALEIEGDRAAAYFQRANARLKLNDAKGARDDAAAALSLDPKLPRAHVLRASARELLGDLDGALADGSQAIALDSRDAQAYLGRARVRFRRGDASGTKADATEALTLDPKLLDALFLRAMARAGLGDCDGAVEDCTRILKEDPLRSAAYLARGMAKEKKKDYRGAIEDATLASMLNPGSAEALSNRAAAKGHLGDYDGAVDDAGRALVLDARYVPALLNRAAAYERKAEAARAVEDYTRALQIRPEDASIRFKRGTLLMSLGLAEKRPAAKLLMEARADFSKVLENDGPQRAQAERRLKTILDALSR